MRQREKTKKQILSIPTRLGLFLAVSFSLTISFGASSALASTLDVTNAEKLSLATSTPIGQKVRVSDGFVVSGATSGNVGEAANGFYFASGSEGGRPRYVKPGFIDDDFHLKTIWDEDNEGWKIGTSDSGFWLASSDEDVAAPWLAPFPALTLTHPAIQELVAPATDPTVVGVSGMTTNSLNGIWGRVGLDNGRSRYEQFGHIGDSTTAIRWMGPGEDDPPYDNGGWIMYNDLGFRKSTDDVSEPWLITAWNEDSPTVTAHIQHPAVFISGAGTPEANGIYTERGITQGRPYYKLLGTDDSDSSISEVFCLDGDWRIGDSIGASLYDSEYDAAPFPWLASWIAQDGNPPAPTVASITQGELDAGATVAGAGTSADNGVALVDLTNNAPSIFYRPISGDGTVSFSPNDAWYAGNHVGDDYKSAVLNHATPFGLTFTVNDGAAPAPTVSRNDVAAEANWQVFTPIGTRLAFSTQPSGTTTGSTISPAVVVNVTDADGNLANTATSSVTLSLGSNPGSATLSGSTTKSVVNGVATFSDLSLNNAGTGYTLVASASGLTGTTSISFNITAVPLIPTALRFNQEPTDATANSNITPAVTLEVLDQYGDPLSSATSSITLALGSNPGSATLSGSTTKAAVSGVATFNDLSINNAGVGYTLTASASGLTGTTSASFTISAPEEDDEGGGSHHSSGSHGGGSSTPTSPTNDSGCAPGNLFSTTTGKSCPPSNPNRPGCAPGNLFSTLTGERCPLIETLPNFIFTRDLTLGSEGEDVRQLQIYLNTHGFPITEATQVGGGIVVNGVSTLSPSSLTGPGSPGQETTHFGPLTRQALARFQAAHGISPALGYFGPITRSAISTLISH